MSVIGLKRRGTITAYNGDGTVEVKLDHTSGVTEDLNTHRVSLPIAFASPRGSFIGGYPAINTPVMVEQAQNEWFVSGFVKSDDLFTNNNLFGIGGNISDLMGELTPGRILLQTDDAANRIYLDPIDGIVSGDANSQTHEDPKRSLVSKTFNADYNFTSGHRSITGPIKRDTTWQGSLYSSSLSGHDYEESLWTVGMDPNEFTSTTTTGVSYRNLPLTESRSLYYELEDSNSPASFSDDRKESDKYELGLTPPERETRSRVRNRTAAFGLNLHYPNHLIEEIKGTGVDVFGNIIDLNRSIIPFGTNGILSLSENEDNIDAFKKIRAAHRKSIAYHFELNARKDLNQDDIYEVTPASDKNNYARSRSTFAFDVDKEGQFKLNIPSSSEIGNVPLPTRTVTSSVLAFEREDIANPNSLFEEQDSVDLYLESYSNAVSNDLGVTLIDETASEAPIGTVLAKQRGGPQDRFTEKTIKLNTPHHNITDAGFSFTKDWINGLGGDQLLVNYMPSSAINQRKDIISINNLVSDQIIVSGPEANAGGRSGSINMDGFLSMSLGANTVDRQSMWFDTAGGVITTLGRDKQGVSYCASLDGDMLVQIGGSGLPATADERFSDEFSAARSGALDVRVIKSDGQMTIVRIDENGVSVATQGRCEFVAQQDLILKSNTQILMEAPNIVAYHETLPRVSKRNANPEI